MVRLMAVFVLAALSTAQDLPVTPPSDGRPFGSFMVQGAPFNVTYLFNGTIVDVAIVVGLAPDPDCVRH
jgi:hypothetical protein